MMDLEDLQNKVEQNEKEIDQIRMIVTANTKLLNEVTEVVSLMQEWFRKNADN